MPLTRSTATAIGRRTKEDPYFAAAVEAELQAMRFEQELVVCETRADESAADGPFPKRSDDARL